MNIAYNMDCMEGMKQYPDGFFDLAVVDPVYGDVPYGGYMSNTGGGIAGHKDYHNAIWEQEKTGSEYFKELFRVSKNQIIWGGNYFELPATRCFNVWRKLTISEGFSMAMCEYAWTSYKTNAKWWEFAPQDAERFHPTQKPLGLICRQLEEYTKPGDLVLDCYSGSGTVAVACYLTGRRFIAVEKNAIYWEKSVARLAAVQAQPMLL